MADKHDPHKPSQRSSRDQQGGSRLLIQETVDAATRGVQAIESAGGVTGAADGAIQAGLDVGKTLRSGTPGLLGNSAAVFGQTISDDVSAVEDVVDSVSRLLEASDRLQPIRYEFSLLNGPDVFFKVRKVRWTEEISSPYRIELELICEEIDVAQDEILGADCELLLERNDTLRAAHGVVERVEMLAGFQVGIEVAQLGFRVTVVPAFKLLDQTIDTRFFQGMSVPQIVEDVLGAALGAYGREIDAQTQLVGEYSIRDYCVQFRESPFDFCNRIMEEEGIAYAFVSDGESMKERIVLFDTNEDRPLAPLVAGDEVPIVVNRSEEGDRESIGEFDWILPQRPNKLVTRGFNAKVPSGPDEAETSRQDASHPATRAQYIHDGTRQIIDDPNDDPEAESFTGESLPQRSSLAERMLQLFTSETKVGRGVSNVSGFGAGQKFTLAEHSRPELDGHEFLLTRVVHEADISHAEIGGTDDQGTHYTNRFECIPIEHVFRPALRTPKPRESGLQSAKVVGPSGEEIHTDKMGRIRVKFQWDRLSPDDQTASCWIRVAQSWAGPGWGAVFIPRIGMEVLVAFIDGNPDNPVVTGCVYNGDNAPPYILPDEKTKTTWKTSSSPGGNGYNELTFEDAAGSEQIIVHAQNDMNETVENNHTTTVHNNQTITVDSNQTTSVGVNQSTSVGGDQSNTVSGNQTESVKKNVTVSVDGTRSQTVTKLETVTLKDGRNTTVGKTESHQVTDELTETFDGGRNTTVKKGDTETVATGDKKVDVTEGMLMVTANTKIGIVQNQQHGIVFADKVLLSTSTDFTVTNGKVSVMSEKGALKLIASETLILTCGAASITLAQDGTVNLQGAKLASLGTPGTAFTAEPSGATINGAKITSQAIGIHEVKGALVKIN